MFVFLDIDGVCHSYGTGKPPFAPECLQALAEALRDTRVVVSSNWRVDHPVDELRERLGPVGLLVVGATPVFADVSLSHVRYQEVNAWLKANAEAADWVAIDDEPDHYPSHAKLYLCDRMTGFTAADVAPFRRLIEGNLTARAE